MAQGVHVATGLQSYATQQAGFLTQTMVALATGAMLLVWFGDQVQQNGLGDGISFIICISIVQGDNAYSTC